MRYREFQAEYRMMIIQKYGIRDTIYQGRSTCLDLTIRGIAIPW
jgi:hypothetical protein